MPGLNRQRLSQFLDHFLSFAQLSDDLKFESEITFEFLLMNSELKEQQNIVVLDMMDKCSFNDFHNLVKCVRRYYNTFVAYDRIEKYVILWFEHKINIHLPIL